MRLLDDDGFSKNEEKEKHISIEAQQSCVLSYTHNFQISAFALHIKIFPLLLLYVENIFLCQSLGYLPLWCCAYTCWQKVDDEENIIWHFRALLSVPTPPTPTLSRPISQALKRYKCTFSSSRPDRSLFS